MIRVQISGPESMRMGPHGFEVEEKILRFRVTHVRGQILLHDAVGPCPEDQVHFFARLEMGGKTFFSSSTGELEKLAAAFPGLAYRLIPPSAA